MSKNITIRRWLRNWVEVATAVHAAHDGIGSLAVHRGLVERGGLIDTLEVEADDLLRLAILLDLEVVGGEAADHFSGLLIADHDVGEHQVAVDLKGVGGLRIRRAMGPDPARQSASLPKSP